MATGPGPQQRFPNHIVRISFPRPGGIVYFWYRYNYGVINDPAHSGQKVGSENTALTSPFDATFDFSSTLLELDNFGILGLYPTTVVPDELSREIRVLNVPLVNPITLNMLKKYAVFAPPPAPYDKIYATAVPAFDVYVIDTAQFTGIYNHMNTFRVTPWTWTRDQALNFFKGSGLLPGQDPNLVGVDFLDNFGNAWPSLPNPITVNALAEGGGSWHTEPGSAGTAHGREGAGCVILNLGLLRLLVPKADRADFKEFTFRVTIPKNAKIDEWELQASAYETGARLAFPVDAKNKPAWPDFGDAQTGIQQAGAASHVDVTVKYGRFVNNVRVPPSVEFSTVSGGGSSEG